MNNLVDRALAAAQPNPLKPFNLPDGGGLFLQVQPNGKKLWYFKFPFARRQRMMGLGQYPEVSLREARDRRDEGRRLLRDGVDPLARRRGELATQAAQSTLSFKSIADEYLSKWRPRVKARTASYVVRRLDLDVYPKLGSKPIDAITKADLIELLQAVDARAPEIARRLLRTLRQIFRYAVAMDRVERDPTAMIDAKVMFTQRKVTNFARIEAGELPLLLQRMGGYAGHVTTQIAMKLMVLTFVRTGELIGARWKEFDLDGAKPRWTIPAARMKMGRPHIVPLSNQAVALLRELQTHSGHREILFPGQRDHDKCMSNNTILKALERMGYKGRMTGHGFRGLASTILHEEGARAEYIEAQLAHEKRDRTAAAYNHAIWLDQRTMLMQKWADYLDVVRLKGPMSGPVNHTEDRREGLFVEVEGGPHV